MATFDYKNHWTEDNLQNIIPKGYGLFPEGWDVNVVIQEVFNRYKLTDKTVLDLGCGFGRLSFCFDSDKYIGVDLNPIAIKKARTINPNYEYREIDVDSDYPYVDLTFAYTVFNHMDEATLRSLKIKSKYMLQCEILGTEWSGAGPVSHGKAIDTYKWIFADYRILDHFTLPYQRYSDWSGKNTNISFILWKRS